MESPHNRFFHRRDHKYGIPDAGLGMNAEPRLDTVVGLDANAGCFHGAKINRHPIGILEVDGPQHTLSGSQASHNSLLFRYCVRSSPGDNPLSFETTAPDNTDR